MASHPKPRWMPNAAGGLHYANNNSRWHIPTRLTASRQTLCWIAAVGIFFVVLTSSWHNRDQISRATSAILHRGPPCRRLKGGDDILVVMKTGASEIEDKLDVHLHTTLMCYPNSIIFSNFEEDLPSGHHLVDAFEYTSPEIKNTHPDFDLYRRLQLHGREGLTASQLSGNDSRETPEDVRKKIPGWQLDKWKFLPMVNQTLHLHPDKHWYVFVEPDTILMWSNLLSYVGERDWTADYFIGNGVSIEEVDMAHGGSGFLLSRPALEKVVALYEARQHEWELFTEQHWIGDHILAAALKAAGVLLTEGKPEWQGLPVGLVKYGIEDKESWCAEAMTFHHMSPPDVEEMWKFEQEWIARRPSRSEESCRMRFRDIFENYILPRIAEPQRNWDNQASVWRATGSSREECEVICESEQTCLQYSFHEYDDGACYVSSKVMYGEWSPDVESGWMPERVQQSFRELLGC